MDLEWQDKRIKRVKNNEQRTLLNIESALEKLWLPDVWVESLRDFEVHRSIKARLHILGLLTRPIHMEYKLRFFRLLKQLQRVAR